MLFNIEPLRMWVHKILPVVYDDSLSYYEVLAKTVKKLNEVIDLTDEQTKFIQEFSDNLTKAINEWEEGLSTEWTNYKKRIDAEWENYKSNTNEDIEIWKHLKEVEIERAVAEGIYAFAEYFEELKNQTVDAADRAGDEADRAEAAAGEAAENAVEAVMPTLQGIFDNRYAFKSAIGSPLMASTVAEMTDTNKIYVYVGDETGYTSGNWYYYDGTAWVSGGVYNSVAVVTDTTLSEAGVPADAKATGDEIGNLKSAVDNISDYTAINLLNEKDLLNITNAVYSDGWYSFMPKNANAIYGTDSFPHREIKPLTQYTISLDGKYDGNATSSLIVIITHSDGTKKSITLNSTAEKHYSTVSSPNKTISAINFSYGNNVKCYLKSLMMVEGTSEPSEFIPYDQRTAVDETARAAAENAEATAKAVETMHRELIEYHPKYNMELGNISFNQHPWWYPNSTTRVRLMSGQRLSLMKGDVISIGGDRNIRYYLGWIDNEGNYGEQSWRYADFVVTTDGEYSILLKYEPEVTISNIEDITSKIIITRGESIYNGIAKTIELNKRHDYFVKSINHQGYSRYAPANSLLAFKLSSYLGFEYVETDVRFTSDGVPVLLHDESINSVARNADGTAISETVNIADITYEQALEYDFGLYKGEQFAGTKIATFEDFLKLCRALSIKPYIEIKDERGTHVAELVNIAKRCGIIDKCTWIAFSWTALPKVTAVYSKARLGLIGGYTKNTIATLQNLKTDDNEVFCDAPSTITNEAITALMDAGFAVEVYTPNNIGGIKALDSYISGVTSDYWVAGEILRSGAMDGVV